MVRFEGSNKHVNYEKVTCWHIESIIPPSLSFLFMMFVLDETLLTLIESHITAFIVNK